MNSLGLLLATGVGVRLIGLLPPPEAVEQIAATLVVSSELEVQSSVVEAVEPAVSSDALREWQVRMLALRPEVDALQRLLASTHANDRALALDAHRRRVALARANAEKPLIPHEVVRALVGDSSAEVRTLALSTLCEWARIDASEAAVQLEPEQLDALHADRWPAARIELCEYLVRVDADAAPRRLFELTRDTDVRVADLARAGLAELCSRSSAAAEAGAEYMWASGRSALAHDRASFEQLADFYAELNRHAQRMPSSRALPALASLSNSLAVRARAGDTTLEALAIPLDALRLRLGESEARVDWEPLVEQWFAAPLHRSLRRELFSSALERVGEPAVRRLLAAAELASRLEPSLRAGATLERSPFERGLSREIAANTSAWPQSSAQELIFAALDVVSPDSALSLAAEQLYNESARELFLGALIAAPPQWTPEHLERWKSILAGSALEPLLLDVLFASAADGSTVARAELAARLDDDELAERAFAALAKSNAQIDALRATWASWTRERRAANIRLLTPLEDPQPFATDLVSLGTEFEDQRPRIASLLTKLDDVAAAQQRIERWLIEALVAINRGEPEERARAEQTAGALIHSLAKADPERALPALERAFDAAIGRSPKLGMSIVRALGANAAGRDRLRAYLERDLDRSVRIEALLSLTAASVPSEEWRDAADSLSRALIGARERAESKQIVRLLESLARLGTEFGRLELSAIAADSLGDDALAEAAIAALAGDSRADDSLAAIAVSSLPFERRSAAIHALGASGSEAALAHLVKIEREFNGSVRVASASAVPNPEERALLHEFSMLALARHAELPSGGAGVALAEPMAGAESALLAAFEMRPQAQASFTYRAELALIRVLAERGELDALLIRNERAFGGAWWEAPADFLSAAVEEAVGGGDLPSALRLAEAVLVAAMGLEDSARVTRARATLADVLAALAD